MSIVSIEFALFVAACLVLYYLLPPGWQRTFLLLASALFLLTWSWQFIIVLAAITIITYFIGIRLEGAEESSRAWLVVGILANLGALGSLKYVDVVLPPLLARVSSSGPDLTYIAPLVLVPLGISYYTLTGISYLVDIQQGTIPASRNMASFSLYMTYFPKLVSGPIERFRKFSPQLQRPRVVDPEVLSRGFGLIAMGLFRKVVLADPILSLVPEELWEGGAGLSGAELWFWMVAYGVALYNDFAGYTELVRGVSRLFGIQLSPNFRRPLFSRSFTQFWNRWHISLSHWLRDYIYYPISRWMLRKGFRPTTLTVVAVPALATMVGSALWHRVSLAVLLWGVINGMYLVGERLLSFQFRRYSASELPAWRRYGTIPLVIALAVLAAVPFVTGDHLPVPQWRAMLVPWPPPAPDFRVLFLLGLWLSVDILHAWLPGEMFFRRWPAWARGFLLAVAALLLLIAVHQDPGQAFIYQQF